MPHSGKFRVKCQVHFIPFISLHINAPGLSLLYKTLIERRKQNVFFLFPTKFFTASQPPVVCSPSVDGADWQAAPPSVSRSLARSCRHSVLSVRWRRSHLSGCCLRLDASQSSFILLSFTRFALTGFHPVLQSRPAARKRKSESK